MKDHPHIAQPIVEEFSLATSKRSRLASAIWLAIKFARQFTDLIIEEDCPITVKSVYGTIPLHQMNMPEKEKLAFAVTREDIQSFYCTFVKKAPTSMEADNLWRDKVVPVLDDMESVSEAVRSMGDEYIRLTMYRLKRGKLGMTIRITRRPCPINESGLPNELIEMVNSGERGLLILTGPSASGKTATALSLLEHINQTRSAHVLTFEDPIEWIFERKNSTFTQREVGQDVRSFETGLYNALRNAPDVLLVGEVRDSNTAETAILAGESGPLVIVTTHGSTAAGSLSKLLSLVGDSKAKAMRTVLAGSFLGVVRQELVPRKARDGYELVSDYLRATPNTRKLIEDGQLDEIGSMMNTVRGQDHTNMNSALVELVRKQVITKESALLHSSNKYGIRELLKNM